MIDRPKSNNYEWYIKHDLTEYSGKWVAIHDEKVVAADKDFNSLVNEVTKRFKMSDVFLTHIPQKDIALVYTQC